MSEVVQKQKENFSPRDFRDALSSFATGVTIVTTNGLDGAPVGMTASSFNSVSTEPALVLWSVTKTSKGAPSFHTAKHFSIHVLSSEQSDLSNRFAKSGEDKFAGVNFKLDENKVPIISEVATRFDCTTWAIYEGGDHWIIVGEVHSIETNKNKPLVFGGGSYATISPLQTKKQSIATEPNGVGVLDDLLFYHLSRAYHQLGDQFHKAVSDSGLSVAEWRISACLFGQATIALPELAVKTFLDENALNDIVSIMQEDGLCVVGNNDNGLSVTGTKLGHDRVSHLFELSQEQERDALSNVSEKDEAVLRSSLVELVKRTKG